MAKMPFLDAVASMSDDRAASERQRPKFSSMARMNTKMPAGQKTKFSQLSLQSNLKKGSSPAIGARAGWRPGVWYVLNSNRWVISHDQNPRLGLTSGTFANLNGGRWDLVGRAISSLDAHLSPASGRTVRQGSQNIIPTATAKTGISLRSASPPEYPQNPSLSGPVSAWQQGVWYQYQPGTGWAISADQDPMHSGAAGIFAMYTGVDANGFEQFTITGRSDSEGQADELPPDLDPSVGQLMHLDWTRDDGSTWSEDWYDADAANNPDIYLPPNCVTEELSSGDFIVKYDNNGSPWTGDESGQVIDPTDYQPSPPSPPPDDYQPQQQPSTETDGETGDGQEENGSDDDPYVTP